MKTPEPINVKTVCSVCGLDWEKHGDSPSLETCVKLLRIELAAAKKPTYFYSSAVPTSVITDAYSRHTL